MKKLSIILLLLLSIGCVAWEADVAASSKIGSVEKSKKLILALHPGSVFELSDVTYFPFLANAVRSLYPERSNWSSFIPMNSNNYKLQMLFCRSEKGKLFMTYYYVDGKVFAIENIKKSSKFIELIREYGCANLVIDSCLGQNYETCSWIKNETLMTWRRTIGESYGELVVSNAAKFNKLMKELEKLIEEANRKTLEERKRWDEGAGERKERRKREIAEAKKWEQQEKQRIAAERKERKQQRIAQEQRRKEQQWEKEWQDYQRRVRKEKERWSNLPWWKKIKIY